MAVERVERWLHDVTAAMNAAKIPYAVIGGNAVALWVETVDPEATRSTKDLDLLVRKQDADRIRALIEGLGFDCENLRGWLFFLDKKAPSRRSGVHLVWANQRVWPSDVLPTPDVEEAVVFGDRFRVLRLESLVRMKLTSFREVDRTHLIDMLHVGVVEESIRSSLPPVLMERWAQVTEAARRQSELPGDNADA